MVLILTVAAEVFLSGCLDNISLVVEDNLELREDQADRNTKEESISLNANRLNC